MIPPECSAEAVDDPTERIRRRRLDALCDISLERSRDDSDEGWSEGDGHDADPDRESELRRDVPPHHG
jgi:hypothetical protein